MASYIQCAAKNARLCKYQKNMSLGKFFIIRVLSETPYVAVLSETPSYSSETSRFLSETSDFYLRHNSCSLVKLVVELKMDKLLLVCLSPFNVLNLLFGAQLSFRCVTMPKL